ncbi:hypothetical protein ACWAUC_12555 [Bradyrhizobium guangdongense]
MTRSYNFKLFGTGVEDLPGTSPLHRCYQEEVWGVEAPMPR